MNAKLKLRILAIAAMAAASAPAVADLGRLSVRSGLDQTCRGTIVATGEEARILRSDPTALKLQSSVPGFAASVSKLKSGSVRISLFSTSAVRDPIVNVTVAVGGLSQSYTAMLDAPKLGAGHSGGTAAVTGRSGYNPSTVSQTPNAKRRAHSYGYRDPASSPSSPIPKKSRRSTSGSTPSKRASPSAKKSARSSLTAS